MTKFEQKQIDRAAQHGRGALLRVMAQCHRAGSARTQREIDALIVDADAASEFVRVNGALLHHSEA